MAYGARGQDGRGRLVKAVVLFVSLVVVVALGAPLVILLKFFADRGSCQHNLASIHGAVRSINSRKLGGPVKYAFTDPGVGRTQAERSLLMLYGPYRDPEFLAGAEALLCPASGAAKKSLSPADFERYRNFPEPRMNCFYSMRNVGRFWPPDPLAEPPVDRPVMADRSPIDDGHPLEGNSGNHRWGNANVGQNVCYTYGKVQWSASPAPGVNGEHIYAVGNDPRLPVTGDVVPTNPTDTILMPVSLVPNQPVPASAVPARARF